MYIQVEIWINREPWRTSILIMRVQSKVVDHVLKLFVIWCCSRVTQHTEGRLNLNFQAHPYRMAFLNLWNMPLCADLIKWHYTTYGLTLYYKHTLHYLIAVHVRVLFSTKKFTLYALIRYLYMIFYVMPKKSYVITTTHIF